VPRSFLPALRGALGLETKGLSERVRASSSIYAVPGQPLLSGRWNVRKAVREGYQANPLVFRAIEVIATNAIKQKIIFRQGDPDDGDPITQISQDPSRVLYTLNRRANPWETAKIFRHRLVAQFMLSSKGVFIEVVRSRSGGIALLNVLDPDIVDILPQERRDASGKVIDTDPLGTFQVQVPSAGYEYLPRYRPEASVAEQPSSVLWLRSPHPTVMWEGMSPTEAAAMSIDLDKYARVYNKRFLQNDGRPGGLISVKGTITPDTEERIQAQFMGGPNSAGHPVVIGADQLSYVDTAGSPRDMQWGDLSDFTRRDIAIAFGVPESVLGDASGRSWDNADAEYGMFWEHRMQPLLDMLDDQLDVLTGGGFDDDLYLRHDTSRVWVLGRHKRERQDRAGKDFDRGVLTVDEYRKELEMEPLEVPATRVLWLAAGKIPAGSDTQDTTDAAGLQQVGMGQLANPAAEAQAGAQLGSQAGAQLAADNTQASQLRLAAGQDRGGGGLERRDILGGEVDQGEHSRARDDVLPLRPEEWR
jgi:HK97 family phage portal protein